jgi:hypothetical protein
LLIDDICIDNLLVDANKMVSSNSLLKKSHKKKSGKVGRVGISGKSDLAISKHMC